MGGTHKMRWNDDDGVQPMRRSRAEKYIDKHKKAIYNVVSSNEDLDDDFDEEVYNESNNISYIHRK